MGKMEMAMLATEAQMIAKYIGIMENATMIT